MPRSVTVRPPWLAATCLLGATIALVPPTHVHELELEPLGAPATIVVEGLWHGDVLEPPNDVDPWMVTMPPEGRDWHGDPHIFLTAPGRTRVQVRGLDDLLSGLWKLVAPVPS